MRATWRRAEVKSERARRASSTMASATALGIRKQARSLRRSRPVEGAGRELACRADELRAADLREHEIQGPRIRLLFGERPAHDAFAVALTVDRKRVRVGDADARRQPLPFGLR